jgi:NitT/TauT family transport system substrate-binding protein
MNKRWQRQIALLGLLLLGCTAGQAQAPVVVRAAHFANITHAQALLAHANGAYQKALGNSARIEWKVFNAGPPVVEAIFAGQIDIAYLGPNPAITGYVRSEGAALRIVAGAMSGGAALIVRADSGISQPQDFRGKRVASPQLANTQDVALRTWLKTHGMKPRENGGDVYVIPISNADQMTLFMQKQLDAAWAPEPWATRLIHEAGGTMLFDERTLWPGGEFATTVVVVRTGFLNEHPGIVKQWIRAHIEMTEWINNNLEQAKRQLNQELKRETTKALPQAVLDEAFTRVSVTADSMEKPLLQAARSAHALGFLGRGPLKLDNLFDLRLLREVARERTAAGRN